jgi:nucleoside 2-deoxyribosyltransferase
LPPDKYLLSYVCRTWPDGEAPPVILNSNVQALLRRAPRLAVPEKRDRLLELMAQETEIAGAATKWNAFNDYPLVPTRNEAEAMWLLDSLEAAGLIRHTDKGGGALTMAGWERVSQLRQAGPNSGFAFVAMSFAPEMSALYDEAIAPAVREAGYEPIRVDRKEHANSIDDEIIGNIRKARFMVADFTGNRAGVYFEAGMMTGLGRTVIWMCDKKELEKVHFDVRQRSFIVWASMEEARKRLRERIVAIEGEGPNKNRNA